ncbi:MAG: sulfatase-like hydrolase/transferase [Bdellovibrionota bacterium]
MRRNLSRGPVPWVFVFLMSFSNRPFFVHTINVGTHHPWGLTLPSSAPHELRPVSDRLYDQYMSRLRYWDDSFGLLFDALSKKAWMKDTVIVMMADHSMNDTAPEGLSHTQLIESNFRVPLALITLGLKPKVITLPVHQIDVAATISALAGAPMPAHYLGHNLMAAHEGSPWVYTDGREQVSYRVHDKSCYYVSLEVGRRCYKNDDKHDPLFEAAPPELREDTSETIFFEKVVAAEHMLHGLNAWTRAFGTSSEK